MYLLVEFFGMLYGPSAELACTVKYGGPDTFSEIPPEASKLSLSLFRENSIVPVSPGLRNESFAQAMRLKPATVNKATLKMVLNGFIN